MGLGRCRRNLYSYVPTGFVVKIAANVKRFGPKG